AQKNLTESIELSETIFTGLLGVNVADLNGAQDGVFAVPSVINWIKTAGATANFPDDGPFPGSPGTTGSENSFVDEIITYVRFPAAGYYQMGVINEDQFRITAATAGNFALTTQQAPNAAVPLPSVIIATNITQLQFGGALPVNGLAAQVVYATPSGVPDEACDLSANPNLAGKIGLIDIGS